MRTLLIAIALTAGCSIYSETQITVVAGADANTTHSQNGSGSNCSNGDCGGLDAGGYEPDAGCYGSGGEEDAGFYEPDAGYYPDAGWCNCPNGCTTGGAGSAIICIEVAH